MAQVIEVDNSNKYYYDRNNPNFDIESNNMDKEREWNFRIMIPLIVLLSGFASLFAVIITVKKITILTIYIFVTSTIQMYYGMKKIVDYLFMKLNKKLD